MTNKEQEFAKEFNRRFHAKVGGLLTEIKGKKTPEERDKAFRSWARRNPQAFTFGKGK
tara:strand:- start:6671 stop:6844 length:174 start_codon:yes stop_codon:yes gene_type:complete